MAGSRAAVKGGTVMNRRDFLRSVEGAAPISTAGVVWPGPCMALESGRVVDTEARPLELGIAPQLILVDFVIEGLQGLERRAEPPERVGKPLLDSATFGCTQLARPLAARSCT